MKDFISIKFDVDACKNELQEFKVLLDSKDELEENEDIFKLLKQKKQLCAAIGWYYFDISEPDNIAYQYPLYGDFTTDLIVMDSKNEAMLLIEFENAKKDSIFKRNGIKSTLDWASRLEHGYSQIIDWLWLLSDMESTKSFEDKFGRNTRYQAILLIGRRKFLDNTLKRRMNWRFEKSIINSKAVKCFSYDDLYEMINRKLSMY